MFQEERGKSSGAWRSTEGRDVQGGGPQAGRGPLRGVRGCFLRWIRQCVFALCQIQLGCPEIQTAFLAAAPVGYSAGLRTEVKDWVWVSK